MGINIKAAIIDLLKEGSGAPHCAPRPLNAAAIAEQRRHHDVVEELFPEIKKARRVLRDLEEKLQDEQELWGRNMRKLQPELTGVPEFRVCDDQVSYTVPETEEKPTPKQPDWVKELLAAEGNGTIN